MGGNYSVYYNLKFCKKLQYWGVESGCFDIGNFGSIVTLKGHISQVIKIGNFVKVHYIMNKFSASANHNPTFATAEQRLDFDGGSLGDSVASHHSIYIGFHSVPLGLMHNQKVVNWMLLL